jgi:hypothetical protein
VFPHLGLIDIPFLSQPLKAKYVELMGKYKGYTTQVMYIVKLKDGSKSAAKFSQMILERVFEMV